MSYPSPTLAGFQDFITNQMQISDAVLPSDSYVIPMAFSVALALVNPALCSVGYCGAIAGSVAVSIYTLAVYNLGGDNIINFAQDVPDAPVYMDNLSYFAYMRKQFNTYGFVSGVISASHDETTGQSLVVQKAAENFTLANLQNLKTPWGRQYLAFAQSYGSLVGLT